MATHPPGQTYHLSIRITCRQTLFLTDALQAALRPALPAMFPNLGHKGKVQRYVSHCFRLGANASKL